MTLHRLREELLRMGLDMPSASMSDQIAWITDLLYPIWHELQRSVLQSGLMLLDSTRLPVNERYGRDAVSAWLDERCSDLASQPLDFEKGTCRAGLAHDVVMNAHEQREAPRRGNPAMTLERLAATLLASALALGGCASQEPTSSAPAPASQALPTQNGPRAKSIHGLRMKRIDGTETTLSSFAGKVLLVVNTASECGYTPQYEGLQALHTKYENRGFAVLGFPSNDFGGQEPGEAQEIASFCKSRYGVTFPMFEKVQTTGPQRAELYAILATAKGEPGWNFHKYLVDKHGVPVAAWGSMTKPESQEIAAAIETALAAP